jgi:DNA-directed RNA polymerase specialized sigma24 family protein
MELPISDLVRQHLLRLRRFSRALNGSQGNGDAHIVRLLEALIADQRRFRRDLSPKLSLFQLFLQLWNAVPRDSRATAIRFAPEAWVDRRVVTLEPAARQAFLLAVVEEFSIEEIATVLQISSEDAGQLVSSGREFWNSFESINSSPSLLAHPWPSSRAS